MRASIVIGGVVAMPILAAFAYFIWPFRYEHREGSVEGIDHLTRQRVTLTEVGWESNFDAGSRIQPEVVRLVRRRQATAKIQDAKAELSLLKDALNRFRNDCGRYPTQEEGFGALRVEPLGLKHWSGPYFDVFMPIDPWHNPIAYVTPAPDGKPGFVIRCYGADGAPGGEGENADIAFGPFGVIQDSSESK